MGSTNASDIPTPILAEIEAEICIEIIKPALHDLCCIYKVPSHIRKLNNGEEFTPHLISIGPFHHNKKELKPMDTQKQRYYHSFWERKNDKISMEKYKNFIKENIEMIKNFYSEVHFENIKDDNMFVDMMMFDSVFILELFYRKSDQYSASEREKDYMFKTSWISKIIQRDLLLLENQIPIFVLEQLYKIVFKDNSKSFLELTFKYFENYNPQRSNKDENEEMLKNCKSCKHFTDLIRCFYLPKEFYYEKWSRNEHFIDINTEDKCIVKTATKLNTAGVSFVKVCHKSLLEVKFKRVPFFNWFLCLGCLPGFEFVKSELQMSQFRVHQNKECVLKNLIAMEQCNYSKQPFICNYIYLLDSLINNEDDVELLVDNGIIVHELGSHEELATMINGLCKNVVVTRNYYETISKKLNKHYRNNWKYSMGVLKSVYFRDAWRSSSTIIGVVFFIFAILNFLRFIGLYHQPK